MLTKRGNKYHERGDKKTTGYSKVLSDQQAKGVKCSPTLSKLSVRGTFDPLAARWLYTRTKQLESTIDKGYYKRVQVLTDFGRSRLKRLKKERNLLTL